MEVILMKRFALVSLSLVWLAACDAPSAPVPTAPIVKTVPTAPASTVISNERIPISLTLLYTCGPEELVAYEGFVHVLVTGEDTENGFEHKLHVNYQGVQGIGLTSGDRYIVQQNENSESSISFDPASRSSEVDNLSRIIRVGSEDNLWARTTFKFSFPPLVFESIRFEHECRG
jgi:hypothetical protein